MLTTVLRRVVRPFCTLVALLLLVGQLWAAPSSVTVVVSPSIATLVLGQQQQFTAKVSGTTKTAVTWSCTSGGGVIGGTGLYTSPIMPGTYTIKATLNSDNTRFGTATVTVFKNIQVSLNPTSATVYGGDQISVSSTVTGGVNNALGVTWMISGGTIQNSGPTWLTMAAPSTPGTYTVTATSMEDSSKSASFAITVLDPSVVTMSVSPSSITGYPLNKTQFSVALRGGSTRTAIWSASGGKLARTGTTGAAIMDYQFPALVGTYQITVTSKDDPKKTITIPVSVVAATYPTIYGIEVRNQAFLPGTSAQVVPYFTAAGATATMSPTPGAVTNGTAYSVQPSTFTQYILTLKVNRSTSYTQLSDWVAPAIGATAARDTALMAATAYNQRNTGHSVVIRPDGKIAVAGGGTITPGLVLGGGYDMGSIPVPDERLFDPVAGTVTTTPNGYRANHATLIRPDGSVQYFGGTTRDGYVFDPTISPNDLPGYGGYVNTSEGFRNRYSGAHVLQAFDGRTVLIGGQGAWTVLDGDGGYYLAPRIKPTDWVELRDSKTGTTGLMRMQYKRAGGVALLMKDGRVFVAGGGRLNWADDGRLNWEQPEVLDLTAKTSTLTAAFKGFWDARKSAALSNVLAAALMADGKVLLLENVVATGARWIGIWDPVADAYSRKLQAPTSFSATFLGVSIGDGLYPLGFTQRKSLGYQFDTPTSSGSYLLFYDAVKNAVVVSDDLKTTRGTRWFGLTAEGNALIEVQGPGFNVNTTVFEPWRVTLALPVTTFPASLSVPLGQPAKFSALSSKNEAITWSVLEGASGGSVSMAGTYTAPTTAGIYHVVATTPSGRSLSTITVISALPVVDRVFLDKASGPVGGTVTVGWEARWADSLHLQTRDANGVILDDLNVTGQTSAAVIVKPGTARFALIAANSAGQIASYENFTLWSVEALTISPVGTSYVIPGGAFKFAASVSGTTGTPTTVTWIPLDGGSVDADGTYHAPSQAGTYHLQAASNFDPSKTAQVTIVVGYAVNSVKISPTGTTYLKPGLTKAFSVSVSVVPGTSSSVLWTTPDGGSVDGNGLFTAPSQVGTYRLKATSTFDTTKFDTVTVVVGTSATLTRFSADPQVISPGKSSTLSWDAQGASTKTLTTPMDEFVNGGGSWDVSNQGGFNATPTKTTTYTLNVSNPFGSEGKTLTVIVSPVTEISITPATTTVYTGSTQAFAGSITSTGSTGVTWSTSDPGGTVSGTGLSATYTPGGTPGTYTVTMASVLDSTRKASATVTVKPPEVILTIDPTTVTLTPGQSMQFGATIQVLGSSNTGVNWTATGGQITGNGTAATFVAGAIPGSYLVTVTSLADTSKAATAAVTVNPLHATVSPSPAALTLSCGAKGTLACSVQLNGPGDTAVTWAATNGSIQSTGLNQAEFTAPSTPGTVQITIQSVADPSTSVTVPVTITPVAITITPTNLALAPGEAVQFGGSIQIIGVGATDVLWSATEGLIESVGPISGRYVAPLNPGTYQVTVTSKLDPNATATALCTVDGSRTPNLTVSPGSPWLPTGGQQAFVAQFGGEVVNSSWSVEDPSQGSIDGTGLYTAPATPGKYQVTATDTPRGFTASVTVNVGILSLAPSQGLVLPGETLQFSAMAGPSTVSSNLSWEIQEGSIGGSIDATGLYTAPHNAGIYHVRVTSNQGTGLAEISVGLIESVVFAPALQVWEAGDFVVKIIVEGSNAKQLLWSQPFHLEAGPAQPGLAVPAEKVRQEIGVDGPYILKKVEVEDTEGSYVASEAEDLGQTQPYRLTTLQRPWVVVHPGFSILGLDLNGNGLADQLQVTLTVDVVAEGNYSFTANLTDQAFHEVADLATLPTLLRAGSNQVTLTLDGQQIRSRGIEGPYLLSGLMLRGPVLGTGPDIGPIAFALTQFEPPVSTPSLSSKAGGVLPKTLQPKSKHSRRPSR